MVAKLSQRYSRLPQIGRKFPGEVSTILRRGTFATVAGGQARSPVLTGATRASHAADGAEPGSLSMRVIVTTAYSPYVHEGTRRMPPRPWLRETTEQTFPETIRELRDLEKAL